MLGYYVNLLVHALFSIPSSLGSNALGIIWPVIVVVCGEIIACVCYGWRTVYRKWKEASLIGFAALGVCYTLLWVYCALNANYQDHSILSSKVQSLQTANDRSTGRQRYAVLIAESKCAETVGRNSALESQNRDQQNTINRCQSEALRLLEPKRLAVYVYDLRRLLIVSSGDTEVVKSPVLVLVNKPVTPVSIKADCNTPISDLQAFAMAPNTVSTLQLNTSRNGPNSMIANIPSPAITPYAPFVLMVIHKKSDRLNCNINVQ